MNATSAYSEVDSHSTTFYPNSYNVTHGVHVSGTTPGSVKQIDSNYFIADAAGSDTSSLQYFPTLYSMSGGTTKVSGSLSNLTIADGTDMIFRSYPWNSAQIEYVDVNTSNVDSVPSIGTQSNFTAQQYGPDTEFDTLMEWGWWDSSYHYRRNINVTTGSNTPYNGYNGYTVQFTIDTQSLISGGKMQSSGNDLRIVYLNGADWEEIDRHVIDINTATTKVRFRLRNNISASSFDDNYYLYYSNMAAGSGPTNLSNVYLWYDDASTDREAQYTQGRLDETAHGGSWRNSVTWNAGGYYSYDTNDNYADSLRPTGLTERDVYVEYEEYNSNAYTIDMTSGPILRWVGTGSGGTETSSHWYYYEMADSAYLPGSYASHDDITADNRGSVVIAYGLLGTFPQLSYTRLALAAWGVNPTNLKAWYDATPTQSGSGSFGISGRFSGTHAAASDNEGAGQVGIWLQQDAGRVRNILIRRYVEPEPSLIIGSEDGVHYELDLELQWTNLDYDDETYGELCIYSLTPGWLPNWGNRVKIVIDKDKIDSSLTDFPLLVHISGSSGINSDDITFIFDELQGDANRQRIAVTTSDGVSQCYVEIEKWNTTNEEAWLWVKVPYVNSAADTVLYLYYDVDQANNTAYVGDPDTAPAEKVWDNNYVGIWHMGELTGGTDAIKDSTLNDNHGTDNGAPTLGYTGKIGDSIHFDGINDYIMVPNDSSLQLGSGLTIEAWINVDVWGNWDDIVFKGGGGAANSDYQFALVSSGFAWDGTYGGTWRTKYFNTPQDTGTWIYAVVSHDTVTVKCYRDGTEISSQADMGAIYVSAYQLGISREGAANRGYLYGAIDEVRISKIARNSAWIKANYENMRDTLVSYSGEETIWLPDWDKRIKLLLNHTNFDENLSDFPVLLHISNSSGVNLKDLSCIFDELKYDYNNKKIAITSSDGESQCYVEIEYWNTSLKEAWLWLKVPFVSNVSDTILYFYYDIDHEDNSDYIGDTGSLPAEKVWDSNYLTVYHMGQTPTSIILDSTRNEVNLTSYGGMTSDNMINGKIGNAIYFDGTNDRLDSSTTIQFESFTFEAWASATSYTNWRTLIAPDGDSRDFCLNGGTLTFWDGVEYTIGPTLSGSEFQYLVVSYNDNLILNRLNGFVNGEITNQTANPSYNTLTDIVRIGAVLYGGSYVDFWYGALDEIRISNISRSSAWIKASYLSSQDSLIEYFDVEHCQNQEKILVDVWNNTAWINILDGLDLGWNNVTISHFLTSSNFTIRFRGANEISDVKKDTWLIDTSLIKLLSTHYAAEVEFEGTSNLFNWDQVQRLTNMSFSSESVNVTIQLYNHNTLSYPSAGEGYLSYVSGAADVKEQKSQLIANSPENYRNGTGWWKLRIIGDKVTSTQYDMNIDLISFLTAYYSEYSAETEFIFTDVTDNQSPYLNFSVITHNSVDGATVTIQVYNYTSSSYQTSGQGYLTYVSTGFNNTSRLNVTLNPDTLLSGTYARIRVTSALDTTVSYQQQTNFVRLLQEASQRLHNYTLRITNTGADAYSVRLNHLGNSDIGRLINCTIYLSSGSTQLEVLGGSVTQSQGGWVGLGGFSSLDILVSSSSTTRDPKSTLSAEVEAMKTGTSTYTKLPVKFVIH